MNVWDLINNHPCLAFCSLWLILQTIAAIFCPRDDE